MLKRGTTIPSLKEAQHKSSVSESKLDVHPGFQGTLQSVIQLLLLLCDIRSLKML